MTLGQRRRDFSKALAEFICWCFENGYYVAIDDVKARDGHKRGSFHYMGLAADLNLYNAEGKYMRETEDHKVMGEEWERRGGTWGGRFRNEDGNHYSWGE